MTKYEVELTDEQARRFMEFVDMWLPPGAPPRPAPSDDSLGAAYWHIAAGLRANPPTPPRMTEPGWGEKVTAIYPDTTRHTFLRWGRSTHAWIDRAGLIARWDDLIDPEPWQADS